MADFWEVIERARTRSGPLAPSADPKRLRKVLNAMTSAEVKAFGIELVRKQLELNKESIWGAGYVIAGGMGDDQFHYFRTWIIGKGMECFDVAMSDPDSLGPFIDTHEVDNEALEYVALEVLQARGEKDDFRDEVGAYADDPPSGEPWDEDSVQELYPKLAARPTRRK